jgi:peptidoglycan-associated lipoprotein
MKNIVLSSVAVAILLFSGCSDKNPSAENSANNNNQVQEVEAVETETVSAENGVISSGSEGFSMVDLEKKLTSIYFAFDKFNIDANMDAKVASNSEVAKANASSYTLKLEGNCDEWGSDEYNFALGLKRAESVKKALVAQGVDANKITMVSYGESNPSCTDKTQECWAENRRVDFKLLP